jgi:chemotaxis protein MotB
VIVIKRAWWVILLLLLAGCGYSEEEWQAQLAKYSQLEQKYRQEQAERERLAAELAQSQQKAAQLSEQLEQMGVNLDALNLQLEAAGTEKQQLASSLEELKRALAEYKKRAAILEKIKRRFEALREKLKKLTDLGLKVEIRNNRMVIRLPGDVLFASGQDKLQDKGIQVLDQVAQVIRNDADLSKRYYQVAGHTDNKPLKGGRFGDNWGLSVMRARQVLLYLIAPVDTKGGGGGLSGTRLHAAGYGETDPVASNATDQGREQNRRVELVVLPDVEEMLNLRELL